MSKKRLIDATDLVRRVLEERDKIRLEVVPRYGFGVPVPDRHGQAMRGGIRKALREIETSPTIDAVEVVRCRDCKYGAGRFLNGDGDVENVWCDNCSAIMPVHGFCHCGARMDGDEHAAD